MRRRALYVAFGATVVALASCRGILGIDDGTSPAASAEAGAESDASLAAEASSQPGSDAQAGGDAAPVSDGGGAKDGGPQKPPLDAATLATFTWAQWPVPASSPGPANYTASTDTVIDLTTGLMWERSFGALVGTANAADHCITLHAGGFSDWRLPTWIELLSIVDYGKKAPAIEPTAFPGTTSDWFWSSTVGARTGLTLAVFFFNGQMSGLPGSTSGRVRCVRNP